MTTDQQRDVDRARALAVERQFDPAWVATWPDARFVLRGGVFEEGAAGRVRAFVEKFLVFSTGEWAGQPFRLLKWQWRDLIGPLYGWRRSDGTRRYRRCSCWVPKKSGKTEIAAALALYHLIGDGEKTPRVGLAAVDRYQAAYCFDPAARMVRRGPLASRVDIVDSRKRMVCAGNDGVLEALSADGGQKEGLNLSALVTDELHAWQDDEFFYALKFAGIARRQPLVFSISTAGVRDEAGIGWREYQYAKGVQSGDLDDDATLPVIYEAAPEADWRAPATWRACNPSLGVTTREDEFAEAAAAAGTSPANEAAFRRYRLNIWTAQTTRWIDRPTWDASAGHTVSLADARGGRVCVGVDIASTRDLSAAAVLFACPHDPAAVDVVVRAWVPEDAVATSRNAALYQAWARSGALTIVPGAVTRYDVIAAELRALVAGLVVEGITLDALFQGLALAQLLADEGFAVSPCRMGFVSLGPLVNEAERLIVGGHLHHGGCPLLGWAIDTVELATDASGLRKPSRQSREKKIDPLMALLLGLDRWVRRPAAPERSIYETRDLLVIDLDDD